MPGAICLNMEANFGGDFQYGGEFRECPEANSDMEVNSGGELNMEADFGSDSFNRRILKGCRGRLKKYGGGFWRCIKCGGGFRRRIPIWR